MSTPRRRGRHSVIVAVAGCIAGAGAFTACSDSDEGLDPQLRTPDVGTYSYDALVYTAAGTPPDTFEGTLHLALSSEDSIVGQWTVDGYADEARGVWNINAYVLAADPTPPLKGTIVHRVWRGGTGNRLDCNLTYQRIEMPADTFTSGPENTCSLVRSGD